MNNQVVLHIAHYAAPYKGNFIASLEALEEKLKENGNNSMVYVFPKTCEERDWMNEFKQKHTVYFVKMPQKICKLFLDGELIKQLNTIFQKENPAIIHSHFDGYDEYCVKANNINAQVVWHEHNPRALVSNKLKQIYQKINFLHQYGVVGKSVHIIALYKDFENFLRKYGYRNEVLILPNGISEERISFKIKKRSDAINFLTFGGRAEHKGIDLLFKSINELKKKNLDIKVYFNITEGSDTRETANTFFRGEIPEEVKLIPQTENVSELFAEMDCFVAPSRRETFSYAVAESMLSGTPAIVSDLEAVSWAFSQKPIITFESENVEDLTKKIMQFISGGGYTADELYDARMYVENNYMTSAWASRLIKYYDEIIDGK